MRNILQSWIEALWYEDQVISAWLMPLSMLFVTAARVRRFLYRLGVLRSTRLPVPVIIAGNITVGGTGKTPLVIYLAQLLQNAGYRPGIISRGYGGNASSWPRLVNANSQASEVGDEAVVIANHCACPMAVGPNRSEAAQLLLEQYACDLILSDDGLQHYALQRDIEIVVVDGIRRFGNGYCLPVGPLREPVSRLREVDLVIVNGETTQPGQYAMQMNAEFAVNLFDNQRKPLSDFAAYPCHAIAGIGNPERFFNLLKAFGINAAPHQFPDHYDFAASDLDFNDSLPVLMTEKDAVKCRKICNRQQWYIPINAEPEARFTQVFLQLLQGK